MANTARTIARILARTTLLLGAAGCAPGYLNAKALDSREQGPSACRKRCTELDLEMGAFVLVGDMVPGCVCSPKQSKPTASIEGAAGAAGGAMVMIAAAQQAAQQQQQQQRRR